jgi:hypothetical protein
MFNLCHLFPCICIKLLALTQPTHAKQSTTNGAAPFEKPRLSKQTRWEIVLAELSLVFHHSIRTLSAFDLHQSVSQVAV